MSIRLSSGGRGGRYSALRGLSEAVLGRVYRGGWPARLADRLWPGVGVALVEHALDLLPAHVGARPPLRIAFVSDLHLGPVTPPAVLDRAFALLTKLAPDVLLLGGDYVYLDATAAIAAELSARVAAVPARTKLAVLGNHDLWTQHPLLERALADAGARVLVNEAAFLPPPYGDVAVVGLDDPLTGTIDADRAFAGAAGARLTIALVHAPEGYPFLRGRGARLALCGHTHGGQVALPGGPIVVPGPLGRCWPAGLFALEDLHLYVSRGVGNVELPLRTFAPPEVVHLTCS